jgi:hypothetical protein
VLIVTVFVENNVSFTCEVNGDKKVQWWATAESGRMPVRCGLYRCESCSRADYPLCVRRRARLVVKGQCLWGGQLHTYVAISNLDAESVSVVESRVISVLVDCVVEQRSWGSCNPEMDNVFSRLDSGMFSTGASCRCSVGSELCIGCRCATGKKLIRFTVLRGWDVPGGSSEFKYWDDVGVSDAVGMHWLHGRERPWLSC